MVLGHSKDTAIKINSTVYRPQGFVLNEIVCKYQYLLLLTDAIYVYSDMLEVFFRQSYSSILLLLPLDFLIYQPFQF